MFKDYELEKLIITEAGKIYTDDIDITLEKWIAVSPTGAYEGLYIVTFNDNGYTVSRRYNTIKNGYKAFESMKAEYERTGTVEPF